MRKTLVALIAIGGLITTMPALAQPWDYWRSGRVLGSPIREPPFPAFGPTYRAARVYAAIYCWRERLVLIRPDGRRIVRWVPRCY
jgi:hypothetical protein